MYKRIFYGKDIELRNIISILHKANYNEIEDEVSNRYISIEQLDKLLTENKKENERLNSDLKEGDFIVNGVTDIEDLLEKIYFK